MTASPTSSTATLVMLSLRQQKGVLFGLGNKSLFCYFTIQTGDVVCDHVTLNTHPERQKFCVIATS